MDHNENQLLAWSATQGYILTGGGSLKKYSMLHRDFQEEDLAHYLLNKKIVRRTYKQWLDRNFRSNEIVGAWKRPLFAGGWAESGESDTMAFNLQTPSIFIDIRIPVMRPTSVLKSRLSLMNCSEYELRLLARQHCFAGYSFPDVASRDSSSSIFCRPVPVFTRHHAIDWNYHPAFPRSHPNRWWVETNMEGEAIATARGWEGTENKQDSFKEHSTVRDANEVPVYMERWVRREPVASQRSHYLAIRKIRSCPATRAHNRRRDGTSSTRSSNGQEGEGEEEERDAILVVVGQHFALVVDRDYTSLRQLLQSQKEGGGGGGGGGGGPAFVDYLLSQHNNTNTYCPITPRRIAEDYLSLEGSYGLIDGGDGNGRQPAWKIIHSTLPWLEGSNLFAHSHIQLPGGGDGLERGDRMVWGWKMDLPPPSLATSSGNPAAGMREQHCVGEWEVLECSFSNVELNRIFSTHTYSDTSRNSPPSALRARL